MRKHVTNILKRKGKKKGKIVKRKKKGEAWPKGKMEVEEKRSNKKRKSESWEEEEFKCACEVDRGGWRVVKVKVITNFIFLRLYMGTLFSLEKWMKIDLF